MSRDDESRDDSESPRPRRDRAASGPKTGPAKAEPGDDGALDLAIAEYLRIGVPIATVIAAIIGGLLQGAGAVVLVLAAGALLSVIAIFWASIRTLVGETPLSGADAYALGAPRSEEEQKRAVLRALKDLEFERSVGKISDEDYAALVTKYRAEAKRLLRVLDDEAEPRRLRVEELVAERLFQEGLSEKGIYRQAPSEAIAAKPKKKRRKPAPEAEVAKQDDEVDAAKSTDDAPAEPEVAREAKAPAEPTGTTTCAGCGTKNDADAVFCKKCGARQIDDDADSEVDAPAKAAREEAS